MGVNRVLESKGKGKIPSHVREYMSRGIHTLQLARGLDVIIIPFGNVIYTFWTLRPKMTSR